MTSPRKSPSSFRNSDLEESQELNSTFEVDVVGSDSPVKRIYPKFEKESCGDSPNKAEPLEQLVTGRPPLHDGRSVSAASSSLRHRRENQPGSTSKSSIFPTLPPSGKTPTSKAPTSTVAEPEAARHRRVEDVPPARNQRNSQCCCIAILLISTPIVCVLFIYFFTGWWTQKEPIHGTSDFDAQKLINFKRLNNAIRNLQSQYPNQERKTWITISAAYKSILRSPNPVCPAVILLSAEHDGQPTSRRLALDLAQLMHDVMNVSQTPLTKDFADMVNVDSRNVKLSLDKALKEALDTPFSAVALYNLQLCPARVSLLLHDYCDTEMAPFSRAVVLLVVDRGTEGFKRTDHVLTAAWLEDLNLDKVAPILTRIGNNKVGIVSEG